MIEIQHLDKRFDGFSALIDLNLTVRKGSIYGLIGTNGAGKTTVIKHLTGALRPDRGSISIDAQPVYENSSLKERLGYIADDLHFLSPYTLKEFARYYLDLYPKADWERYTKMIGQFHLDERRRLSRFSKGMQKQAAFALVMSTQPDYLILDEPIDGLDPIIRKLVWNTIVTDVAERKMTVLISSHNLREMEGICDTIGILSHGHMLIERDLDELKSDIHKIQVVFPSEQQPPLLKPAGMTPADSPAAARSQERFAGLNVLHHERHGSVELLVIRDKRERVEEVILPQNPTLFDLLPLSLEEIFIYELGGEQHEWEHILF